jgi:hypothetical protein
MRLAQLAAVLLLASPLVANSTEQTDTSDVKAKLMEETRVVAVTDIEGPSSMYKDDGDPNTLEVVFLSKRSDGPSRVSADGEVVFLYNASEDLQSDLIGKAFELRLARATGGR